MTDLIEADALGKSYRDVVAAREISFKVSGGEVVGLLGPNGAGKTTVLRMLAGILTPSEGHARIAGIDSTAEPFEVKKRLGFLSGDTALYRRLTPREMLRYFGELHEMDREFVRTRTDRLVDELRMEEFMSRRCETLSDGQKQKANLARAFLHDPPVLILDEPTSSLDVVTGRFVLDAISRARAEGKAVLFSTHIMSEAEFLSDRVILLHEGSIMDQGTVAEVCERAGSEGLTETFLKRIDQAGPA